MRRRSPTAASSRTGSGIGTSARRGSSALRADAEALAARVAELRLEIPVKAGERGRLFGAVTSHQIADLIARSGIELDRHALHLREPIKTLGDYKIDVRIMPGVETTVSVSVVPEA